MKKELILSAGLFILSLGAFATSFDKIFTIGKLSYQDSGKGGIEWLIDTSQVFNASVYGYSRVGNRSLNLKNPNDYAMFHPNTTEGSLSEALMTECSNLSTYSVAINSTSSSIGNFFGEAMPNGNVLNWRTSLEENNKGFVIESSSNGIEFEKVGFKRPLSINGSSNEPIDYTFIDKANSNNTYYRLKQIDMNGKSEHSQIILVKSDLAPKAKLKTTEVDDLNMVLSSNKTDIATLLLLDESGNVVYQKNETIVRGKNNISINTFNLPNGCYVLQVKNGLGELVLTRKIVEM